MKNLSKGILFFLSILIISTTIKAQRVEIEAKRSSENIEIVPVEKEGMLVMLESDEKDKKAEDKSVFWEFTLYDTEFKEKWSREISLSKGMSLVNSELSDGDLYLVFSEGAGSKKQNFQALELNLTDGYVSTIKGIAPSSDLSKMSVNRGGIFLGGTTLPTKGQIMGRMAVLYCTCLIPALFGYTKIPTFPLLYYINFDDGQPTDKHPKKKEFKGIADVNTLSSTGNTEVLVKEKPEKKARNQGFVSKVYDYEGSFLEEYKIKSKSSNILTSGFVSSNGGEKFVVGTFKKNIDKDSKKKYKVLGGGESNGVFFTRFDEKSKQKVTEFFDFTEFNGFDSYISKRTGKKIKRKERGKRKKKVLLSYDLLVQEPIYTKEEIIVISEAYYKEYHTEYYTDANGRTTTRQVFDGYRTTHALISAFSRDGELKWSSTFGIGTLSWTLKNRVRLMKDGKGKIVMAYSFGGNIYSKVIEGNQLVDASTTKIPTQTENEKVKSNSESDILYWYDDNFVAFGYQKIKKDKRSRGTKRKRTVFYFNKISLQD